MASLAGVVNWNPWHGCTKVSEGCLHCYVYELDQARGVVEYSNVCRKTASFNYPLQLNRDGTPKIPRYTRVMTCMTSDFFLADADSYREDAWNIMRIRKDLLFMLVTKRPERILHNLPYDWNNEGWPNIWLNVSAENQRTADERIPLLLELPFKHKGILAAPLLEQINIKDYLQTPKIGMVSASGEHANEARPLDFLWIQNLKDQCEEANVNFEFFSTGSILVKDGKTFKIPRAKQKEQAEKACAIYNGHPIHLNLAKSFAGQQESLFAEGEEKHG